MSQCVSLVSLELTDLPASVSRVQGLKEYTTAQKLTFFFIGFYNKRWRIIWDLKWTMSRQDALWWFFSFLTKMMFYLLFPRFKLMFTWKLIFTQLTFHEVWTRKYQHYFTDESTELWWRQYSYSHFLKRLHLQFISNPQKKQPSTFGEGYQQLYQTWWIPGRFFL